MTKRYKKIARGDFGPVDYSTQSIAAVRKRRLDNGEITKAEYDEDVERCLAELYDTPISGSACSHGFLAMSRRGHWS